MIDNIVLLARPYAPAVLIVAFKRIDFILARRRVFTVKAGPYVLSPRPPLYIVLERGINAILFKLTIGAAVRASRGFSLRGKLVI